MKKKALWITMGVLLIIIVILFVFFLSSYQYHHYWEGEEHCHYVDYYSNTQAADSGQTNLLIQNNNTAYGEFLSGQILYKDDFVISLDLYRQSPNSLICVTQFVLESEKLNQYEYKFEIFHDLNLVPMKHTQKIGSLDQSQNYVLLEEKEARLQSIQQFMFTYSNIKAQNDLIQNGISTCYTYITEFQINYHEESFNPEFKVNMSVISNKNDTQLSSYSLSKLLYNIK